MGGYTVKQVAKLSGVSVRALHHYDEVGLLKPACVGANGYRYYGRDELLRLQQILFHRELGFSLDEIGRVLDATDFDRTAALVAHRRRLDAEARRYRRLICTIDETLAALQGATDMNEKAMYRGFDPKKQASYEAWVVERYGPGAQASIAAVKQARKAWTQTDYDSSQAEIQSIEGGLADAMREGLPPDSERPQTLVRHHHAWVQASWAQPLTAAAYENLAKLYEAHPDFQARYEGLAVGLTEYLQAAMRAFARREL